MAKACGITQAFLSELESGKKARLGADILFRLIAELRGDCRHFTKFFEEQPTDGKTAK